MEVRVKVKKTDCLFRTLFGDAPSMSLCALDDNEWYVGMQ
jgi:hypothetical protein